MMSSPLKLTLTGCCSFVALALSVVLPGCPEAPPKSKEAPPAVAVTNDAPVRWRLNAARRQGAYVKLDLPVVVAGTRITLGEMKQIAGTASDRDAESPAGAEWRNAVGVYSSRIVRGSIEGPLVDQLMGQPRMATDAGSYLVPAAFQNANGGGRTFEVPSPMPLFFRVTVPPAAVAGEYRIPVVISAPGKPVEGATLAIEVADLSLPTDPRVLAVATTTTGALSTIYPDTFGSVAANYLDRASDDQKGAVAQLDALVKAAREQGVALFVEDLLPTTRVDALGQVNIDWDAYDRVMQPYMDGTAFEDRIPFPLWLAPVPPRRLRDAPTQLWQYIDACAKHFAAKGWVATPAFMHPAMANSDMQNSEEGGRTVDVAKLRADVGAMMRLHMPREMLAVSTPDPGGPPHAQLWTINDDDARLPPGGALANEYSIRAWPLLCLARGNMNGGSPTGVKGFVWRDALAGADALSPDVPTQALFVAQKNELYPTFRMMYLSSGLHDAAFVGLLQKRTDPTQGPSAEILAGMVGRTATNSTAKIPGLPIAPSGFLYAGWSGDRTAWMQVSPTLQRLILESDPGTRATIKPDDPLYLAAKVWLAQSRRPVARVAGYSYSMRAGQVGNSDILDAMMHVLVENPIDVSAPMDLLMPALPGDFQMPPLPVASGETNQARRRSFTVPATGTTSVAIPMAGHVRQLETAPATDFVELSERHDGAVLRFPMQLPVYRTHAVEAPPKIDGDGSDWLMDPQLRVFGEMKVAQRYLSRPDPVSGVARPDENAAIVRWSYDDNFLYILARCPQDGISDERNTDWPTRQISGSGVRWWGTDGLQIELSAMPPTEDRGVPKIGPAYDRIVKIAFKPAGVVLVQTGSIIRDGAVVSLSWRDGPPPAAGNPSVKYGITTQRQNGKITGYTVEAAIPRIWIDAAGATPIPGTKAPAWRLNVLRHRASDLASTSWAGPVVHDDDVAMMGALLGE